MRVTLDFSIFVSLGLLFGIAAQFRAANGYVFLREILATLESRLGVMYAVVVVTAVFSPFILNDVLVLILTPVIASYAKEAGADVAPLVVAEITFTNIASSLTPLGNPQNILLWQESGISAAGFVAGTWIRLLASGAIAAILLLGFRQRKPVGRQSSSLHWHPKPALYLASSAALVFFLSFLRVPSVIALAAAFLMGFVFTFGSFRSVATEFDLRSLLILFALVGSVYLLGAVVAPFVLPYVAPVAQGVQPAAASFFGVGSALISNVPATQLVLSTASVNPHAAPILAVDAGLAGNIDPISSFANLLALLILKRNGLAVRKAIILQLMIGLVAFTPAFF
jgi:Na+/H+ antiporter NhaD/arsenite permease-like protein